jgi:hypothetical protein
VRAGVVERAAACRTGIRQVWASEIQNLSEVQTCQPGLSLTALLRAGLPAQVLRYEQKKDHTSDKNEHDHFTPPNKIKNTNNFYLGSAA